MICWLKHENEVHNAEDKGRGTPLQNGNYKQSHRDIKQSGKTTVGEIKDLECTARMRMKSEAKIQLMEIAVCYVK